MHHSEFTPNNSFYDGYVLYSHSNGKSVPIGVISTSNYLKATCSALPEPIEKYLIETEDKRFFKHHGIDPKGIFRAAAVNIKAHKYLQGGSTITQQLSRNMLRDNSKTISRKLKETIKAIKIEHSCSKKEILQLYFDNVFFGKNMYGLRAASLYYFFKEPLDLSPSEQLFLISILRGPNYYANNYAALRNRFSLLNDLLYSHGIINLKKYKYNKNFTPSIKNHSMQLFGEKGVEAFSTFIDRKSKKIVTNIDLRIQNILNDYVHTSKYPVSIICVSAKSILGVASSYGTDHPFSFKSNVGSTLKPFLYSFLRETGILKEASFPANKNSIFWTIREATVYKEYLSLAEALFRSNNNVFVNACNQIGFNKSLDFLSGILQVDRNKLHPSSILGAVDGGLSLYGLTQVYIRFFYQKPLNDIQVECLNILSDYLKAKTGLIINGVFLKSGTTNNNSQRFAILGNPDKVLAISRHENFTDDFTKNGSFLNSLERIIKRIFPRNGGYQWV